MGNPIYITREFDDELLEETFPLFREQVRREMRLRDGEVTLLINSPGGIANVLVSFLDEVEFAKSQGVTVRTEVMGQAASCGSILAMSGTPGHRFISPNSYHYVHVGRAGATGNTLESFTRYAEHASDHFKRVEEWYRRYAKIPGLKKKLEHDHLFVKAEQAIEWGLADELSY